MLTHYLAVAIGGAAGSVLRFALHEWMTERWGRGFPWGTLSINILGSFLLGVLFVVLIERLEVPPALRLGLMVGVLGGFTTFSTFSMDAVHLFSQGFPLRAIAYMLASVVVCVAAAFLGIYCARWLM